MDLTIEGGERAVGYIELRAAAADIYHATVGECRMVGAGGQLQGYACHRKRSHAAEDSRNEFADGTPIEYTIARITSGHKSNCTTSKGKPPIGCGTLWSVVPGVTVMVTIGFSEPAPWATEFASVIVDSP